MDGDHPGAGIHRPPRDVGRIEAVIVPAEPHLDRDRQRRRAHNGLDQPLRQVRHAHQGRAGKAVGHALGRAAEIDVDDVGARVLGDLRRRAPSTALRSRRAAPCAAGPGDAASLRRMSSLPTPERAAGDHLRDDEPGAISRGQPAHRSVGDAGHRREEARLFRIAWPPMLKPQAGSRNECTFFTQSGELPAQ